MYMYTHAIYGRPGDDGKSQEGKRRYKCDFKVSIVSDI